MAIGRMRELGAEVRAERHRRGLSQAELAARAGVSREWLGRLEHGAPRLEADRVLAVLQVLDFSVVAKNQQPTQADIAQAQKIAWTMGLEAQPITDEGFQRVLEKIVRHRIARSAA
ncbi:helix-turn-helix domain-containing protein [Kribbella sp.]|uniref:helix-turn-helix domain-containing protein n=1 Tax=Kribbella sp. TaxID=1871183 RepID=UPI002D2E77FC|nr:helix-turn-helix domain-containing protein [Kribbella sp.]HZX02856.1 helix-turn-helix domain-containing protein [Kribbella sp.]